MKQTIRNLLMIFCIVVMLLLSYRVYYENKDISCDRCSINFKNTRVYGQSEFASENKIRSNELFEELNNNNCIIKWDKNQGWTGGTKLDITK